MQGLPRLLRIEFAGADYQVARHGYRRFELLLQVPLRHHTFMQNRQNFYRICSDKVEHHMLFILATMLPGLDIITAATDSGVFGQ